MVDNGRINSKQMTILMITTIISTAVIFLPAISAAEALQDAWLSPLAAMLLGIGMATLIGTLALRFPEQTLISYSQDILGAWLGRLVGLLYIWWFIHMNSVVIREFGDFLTTAIMPETPLELFNIVIVILAASAVRNGLEVITRVNDFLFPILIGSFAIILLLVLPDFELANLKPVLADGIKPVLRGALAPASWLGEIAAILFIIPFMTRPGDGRKYAIYAIIIIGLILSFAAIVTLGVFGAEITLRFKFPIFSLARVISIGQFLERTDPIIMAIWIGGVFIKIAIFYWVAVIATTEFFKLRSHRPVVLPIGILLSILSITLYENVVELVDFLSQVWPTYALLTFEIGLPALLLTVALIRGKGGKNRV